MTKFNLDERLPDGRARYNVLSNGSIQDMADKGHLVKAPDVQPITKENSHLMLARKHELAQQRAIEGIDEAAIAAGKIPKGGTGDGWQAVVKHVTATLLDSKNLRGQAEAANFLSKAAGYTVSQDATANFGMALMALLDKHLGSKVIEGKVLDES